MKTSRFSVLAALVILVVLPAAAQTGPSPQSGAVSRPLEASSNSDAEKRSATRNLVLAVRTRAIVRGVVTEKIETIPLNAMKSAAQGASPFMTTIRLSIPRYADSFIYGLALFEYPWGAPCFWLEAGSWTLSATGSDLGTTRTIVEPGVGPCDKYKNVDFATVRYQWNSYTNRTRTPGDGPLDTFTGEWKASGYDLTYNFVVFVDAVRPVGETNEWKGWADGGRGKWLPTLVAPDSDPGFDFSGETVKESHVNESTCIPRVAGGSMGGVPSSVESKWTIVAGNKYNEEDGVGWRACAVEFFRCTKATPCGYTTVQIMKIKSPADTDFTTYQVNTLRGGVDGLMLPFTNNQTAIGFVSSQRGESEKKWKFYLSNKNSCAGFAGVKLPC